MTDLLAPWHGDLGGFPPFATASPNAIESAYREAIGRKRHEVRAIVANVEPASFENTILALEQSGAELRRVEALYHTFSTTLSSPEMREVDARLAALPGALDDEIAHDNALFARIEAASASLGADRDDSDRRLAQVTRERLVRRGAGLPPPSKLRLAEINRRIAELQARFKQNLIAEGDAQAVLLCDPAELVGLSGAACAAAADAAERRGRRGWWAITNTRPAVMSVLTTASRRNVREQVWRMWMMRGENAGEFDNRPVIAEILKLRGEKARLFGFSNFALYATADRMAGSPQTALTMLHEMWARVLPVTLEHLRELEDLAAVDQPGVPLAAWDRYFYAERWRRTQYGIDDALIRSYLPLQSLLDAVFWAAGSIYGVTFAERYDAPVPHSHVRVFTVERAGEPIGALYCDLFERAGKMRGSWQYGYRAAQRFPTRVLPLSSVNSNLSKAAHGEPQLLTWELARVLFHEFGHALHMLLNESKFESLGSLCVPWDFIEVPSLLNERWLEDGRLLRRFARHHLTGEPIPDETIEKLGRSVAAERVFSVTLDYLSTAIVDMRMHVAADGGDVDAIQIEREVLAELNMPDAIDPTLRVPHLYHSFTDHYAAGVYVYLWGDIIAADAAEAFVCAPDGLLDCAVAEQWRRSVLAIGNTIPVTQAYRTFRGRDADPDALLRRFDLQMRP